jgi:phosphoribosylanthranilate isomerase
MRTRVKICGLTRINDIQAAIQLGADAIGLVFYPPSPRSVTIEQASALLHDVPAFVSIVGLFVNAEPDWVRSVLHQVPITVLQFHGHEEPDYCATFQYPWIKAISVQQSTDFTLQSHRYAQAAGLLYDTYDPDLIGGTGRTFDWSLLPAALAAKCIIAGGLTPENVATAITRMRPYAVDVSGGVEEQTKGCKDYAKIAAFMQGVQHGDQSR